MTSYHQSRREEGQLVRKPPPPPPRDFVPPKQEERGTAAGRKAPPPPQPASFVPLKAKGSASSGVQGTPEESVGGTPRHFERSAQAYQAKGTQEDLRAPNAGEGEEPFRPSGMFERNPQTYQGEGIQNKQDIRPDAACMEVDQGAQKGASPAALWLGTPEPSDHASRVEDPSQDYVVVNVDPDSEDDWHDVVDPTSCDWPEVSQNWDEENTADGLQGDQKEANDALNQKALDAVRSFLFHYNNQKLIQQPEAEAAEEDPSTHPRSRDSVACSSQGKTA